MTQKVLDICSGIGGFTLGHMISGGFETIAFCEINSYCRQVLNLRFPGIPIIGDIHDITIESLYGAGVKEVDGIIAGLPCPPFSLAGKQKASSDERNLFPQFFGILRSVRPRWAIVENVPGLITAEKGRFLRGVLWEFASLGFNVEWGIMASAQVGAVHLRERIWLFATNSQSIGAYGRPMFNANSFGNEWYSQEEFRELGNATNTKSSRWGTSGYEYTQAGANPTLVGCNNDDAYTNGKRLETWQSQSVEQTALAQPQRRSFRSFAFSRAQRAFCGSAHGFSYGLDECLLTHTGLADWFAGATIPSFNRLSRAEIAALTPTEQTEYRQLYQQYLAIRRQHKEQLKALGNAIVPQCAALIFDRLKHILMLQESNLAQISRSLP